MADLKYKKKQGTLKKEALEKAKEMVNHPSHYQKGGKECIDVMEEEFGTAAVIDFCICNAFKYRFRAGHKVGNPAEQDEAKALWYEAKAEELKQKLQ